MEIVSIDEKQKENSEYGTSDRRLLESPICHGVEIRAHSYRRRLFVCTYSCVHYDGISLIRMVRKGGPLRVCSISGRANAKDGSYTNLKKKKNVGGDLPPPNLNASAGVFLSKGGEPKVTRRRSVR